MKGGEGLSQQSKQNYAKKHLEIQNDSRPF